MPVSLHRLDRPAVLSVLAAVIVACLYGLTGALLWHSDTGSRMVLWIACLCVLDLCILAWLLERAARLAADANRLFTRHGRRAPRDVAWVGAGRALRAVRRTGAAVPGRAL